MEALTRVLAEQSAQQLVYARLSRELGIAVDTARHWVELLGLLVIRAHCVPMACEAAAEPTRLTP
jgi:predicted AAA+ superfamily ATPase